MNLKVCGMRDAENIKALSDLKPDFIGFIFYDKSPRNVGEDLDVEMVKQIPKRIKKVGVFVNAKIDFVVQKTKKYGIDHVQLHGNEMPDYCKSLRKKGLTIIKAFSVDSDFNFALLNSYRPNVDYFLFDAKGTQHGGNGHAFNWQILENYTIDTPYFLAGGIDLENIEKVKEIPNPPFSIDVNSKFEIVPGLKDIPMLESLIFRNKNVLQTV